MQKESKRALLRFNRNKVLRHILRYQIPTPISAACLGWQKRVIRKPQTQMQSPLLNDSHNSGNSKVDTILHLNSLVYYNLHFCFHSTDQANHTNEHAADKRGRINTFLPSSLSSQRRISTSGLHSYIKEQSTADDQSLPISYCTHWNDSRKVCHPPTCLPELSFERPACEGTDD